MKFKKLNISVHGTPIYVEDGQPSEFIENYLRTVMNAFEKEIELPKGFDQLFGKLRK